MSVSARLSEGTPAHVSAAPAAPWLLRATAVSAVLAFGVFVAVVLLGRLGSVLRMIVAPQELMYGEAIVYDQAARIVNGHALYQAVGDPNYSATAYGPLYYWCAAALQALVGPGFTAGRVLSFVAGMAAAALIGRLTYQRTRHTAAGVLAAGLFLVGSFSEEAPWYAFYKEDVLGIAFALAAIVLLSGGVGTRRIVGAAVFASLAILTKQSLVAAAVAGALWCVPLGWRRVGLFAAVVVVIVGGTSAALELTSHAFVLNTIEMNMNPTSLLALRTNLQLLVEYQVVQGVTCAAAFVLGARALGLRTVLRDPLVLYGLCAIAPLVGLAKVGSNYNYLFELAAALSVFTVVVIWRACTSHDFRIVDWLTLVIVLAGLSAEIGLHARATLTQNLRVLPAMTTLPAAIDVANRQFDPVLERVRAEPGTVLADPLDVLPLAGHEIYFEPYIFSILNVQGRWDAQPVVNRICHDDIHLVVLGYPLDVAPLRGYHGYGFWPPAVLDAFKAKLTLDSQIGGRYLYVTNPRTTCN